MKIKVLNITDTEIRAEITVLSDATSGISTIPLSDSAIDMSIMSEKGIMKQREWTAEEKIELVKQFAQRGYSGKTAVRQQDCQEVGIRGADTAESPLEVLRKPEK